MKAKVILLGLFQVLTGIMFILFGILFGGIFFNFYQSGLTIYTVIPLGFTFAMSLFLVGVGISIITGLFIPEKRLNNIKA